MNDQNTLPDTYQVITGGSPIFLKLEKMVNNVGIRVWEKSGFLIVTSGEPIPRINLQRLRSQSGTNAATPILPFRLFSNRLENERTGSHNS